jgi:hypothetical protein
VRGVPDRGDDPAVVALVGGHTPCSGALIAADVVLTARRCVVAAAQAVECPTGLAELAVLLAPESLRILVGDPSAAVGERARGRAIVAPRLDTLCGSDIALVLLDAPIDDIQPLSVRATGAAKGDHLRTASFVAPANARADKLVRDHLPVLDATATELRIAEACEVTAGGPALDESTGQIVAVASRPVGPSCRGANALDVYTRADAFLSTIAEALAKSTAGASGARGKKKTKKGPIDMGANCVRGSDCAAGVCVTERAQEYCSRTCQLHDRCPVRYRCQASQGGEIGHACVEQ